MMSMYDVRTMFTCPLLCRSISEDKLIVGGWVGGGVRVSLSVCLSICLCVRACVRAWGNSFSSVSTMLDSILKLCGIFLLPFVDTKCVVFVFKSPCR